MNTLYYGDNLDVLRNKIKDESVDLCYIDPPFNSKRNYNQIYNNIGSEDQAQAQAFVDTWVWDDMAIQGWNEFVSNEQGRFTSQTIELMMGLRTILKDSNLMAYLVSMALRVNEIYRVLKPTGSFYLHCDPTASHYLKIVLDTIFVARGGDYRNEVIWKRTSAHSDAKQGRRQYGQIHDVLLFYTKSTHPTWNTPYKGHSESHVDSKYNLIEPETGRRYSLGDLTGPGGAAKGNPSYEVMGVTRHWRFSKAKMEELIAEGRIVQPRPGAVPRQKRYLDESLGTSVGDTWDDIPPINSQAAERLGYPTQKPEALLERIIKASSNEGDVVLDAYCGCGTTIAVAQHLKRRWIGIDITYQSIALMLRRLQAQVGADAWPLVEKEISLNGIPRDMESAQALALKKDDRVRKEFEKWAVLTYSRNLAIINDKKGADAGIDGIAYFLTGSSTNARIVFQVKSGKVGRGDIAKLNSDRMREKAEMAYFLTLNEPTKPMRDEARAAGQYQSPLLPRTHDRIQIVTVREMLEGARLDMPLNVEVLKAAQVKAQSPQLSLIDAVMDGGTLGE